MRKKVKNIAITMGSVLMVSAALAGAFNGVQNIREHNAYAESSASEMYMIGSDAIDGARNALASFTIGVADGTKSAKSLAAKSFGQDFTNADDYFQAGKDFQAKHHLSEAEILEFVQHTAQVMKDTSLKASSEFSKGPIRGAEHDYAVWSIAALKGILEAAEGKVQIDPRLSDRIDQFLADQPAAAQSDIAEVVAKGKSLAEPLSQGNDKLWAGVTHQLREVPREAYWTFRNTKTHRDHTVRIDTPGSSFVEPVDLDSIDTNITVDPFQVQAPAKTADPSNSL